MTFAGRSRPSAHADREALATDLYLDRLLRTGDARSDPSAGYPDLPLAPELREAAAVLRRTLVALHPTFRFEESLAAALRRAWGVVDAASPARAGQLVPFAPPPQPLGGAATMVDRRGRGLIVGGAIASGVSLAGAAWVVWRWGRGKPS